jgi:lipopolysaccharide/colanic/teichoic acid biosynthesis glycosyltransferase
VEALAEEVRDNEVHGGTGTSISGVPCNHDEPAGSLSSPSRNAPRQVLKTFNRPRWKDALDWLLILLTFPAWFLLMVFIAIGIKIVSRGPVFFCQERMGYGRKSFLCLKFRTMKADADASIHSQHLASLMVNEVPMTKLDQKGDPRLIRFARFLRATGLDELPQIFNIIRREMSFVGPRPCTLAEFSQYAEWHKERFDTLPGLTGLWQVCGKNQTTFKEMINLDVQYTRKKTLGLDLQIICRTMPAIIQQIKGTSDSAKLCNDRRARK